MNASCGLCPGLLTSEHIGRPQGPLPGQSSPAEEEAASGGIRHFPFGCWLFHLLDWFVVAFHRNLGQGRELQATQGKKNRSEVMKSLLISQDTWGDLTMSTNPLTLLPEKTKLNTTPLPLA